ncbi:site-2 protease family protein [Streptomyces olivoreticuli]|uniref:site-2 protease family protein n=1 Tax=Streptomyces olivoreticuli TaxID=68246 RepID=UPI000E2423F3|nr:site-2 protease family protein [Streptomyces olivoreticuli]
MGGSLPLGKIFGVPLRIHWSAPVLIVFLGMGLAGGTLPAWVPGRSSGVYDAAGLAGAVLLTVSLLLHESAHAVIARRAGIQVEDITVWGLGGVTRLGRAATPRVQLAVSAAGPLTSLFLGGIVLAAGYGAGHALHWALTSAVLVWAGWANLLLGAFNLLPATPLDGGRILQAALWWRGGDRARAQRVAGRCGQAAGFLLVVGGWFEVVHGTGAGLWLMLVGGFVTISAGAEIRQAVLVAALEGVRVGDVMTPEPLAGPDWHTVDQFLTEVMARTDRRAVPLFDFEGRPSGLAERLRLSMVPASQRGEVRVRDVAVPLGQCTVATSQDDLVGVLERATPSARLAILVVDGGRLVGTVTGEDIARAARRRTPDPGGPLRLG